MSGRFDPELVEIRTLVNNDRSVDIYKIGGGTLGTAYEGLWGYRLTEDRRVIAQGEDLRTGTTKTHEEATQLVLDLLDLQEL